MAQIYPFSPFRYTEKAGPVEKLVTQPYDKISPEMRKRYLSLSPYNLVRIILGDSRPGDSPQSNVYTRAATYLNDWMACGILARDAEPCIFPYFQEFIVPDTGEQFTRKGFIALGAVVDYSEGIVHRHEQTLSGPKKDRLELLRHTHAHFGQIFMLYPDPASAIDSILGEVAGVPPLTQVTDEYGTIHRLWKISGESSAAARICALMADKKLLIADGHHRYETALAFRNEDPSLPGADRVMMTFVNMHSRGLKILATHRLVSGIDSAILPRDFLHRIDDRFETSEIDSVELLQQEWASTADRTIIGAAIGDRLYMLDHRTARGELDVRILHEDLLDKALGIGEDAVRDEKHLRYVRGLGPALEAARDGAAQIAFLLKPTSIHQVASTSFSGGVMPQKSTDFYPKLLSGLTIYKLPGI
ncbi:MAG: DUF1015 domain-containing protein [Acidobacteriia bacterium]|nr:DUF1015 domain-containing protein [Terriglobia bacterium]